MCNRVGKSWNKRTALEKRCVVAVVILSVILLVLIISLAVNRESKHCITSACIKTTVDILHVIDTHKNPCDDFYEYACGNFPSLAEEFGIRSVLERQSQKNKLRYKALTLDGIRPNDSRSLRLQKQYYQACTNLTAIDGDDDRTFYDLVRRLGGWPAVSGNNWNESAFDFGELMVTLRNLGLRFDWFLDITLFMENNDLLEITYPDGLKKMEWLESKNYSKLMTEIAVLFGAREIVAREEMRHVAHFENRLARVVEDVRRKSLNKNLAVINISEVQHSWQRVNWLELLNHITNDHLNESTKVVFLAKDYVSELDTILKTTAKRAQANYVIWKLIQSYASFLSGKIRKAVAEYEYLVDKEYPLWYRDREGYCYERATSMFLYVAEAEFVRRYAPKEKVKKIHKMAISLAHQMEKRVMAASWMDEETKLIAISKLENISYIIGGPEEMYDSERFDRDFVGTDQMMFDKAGNIIKIQTEITKKGLDFYFKSRKNSKINIQESLFYDLVPSVSVRFLRDSNTLHIPAGALQELFYDENRPEYLNYAVLGTIIGHELTHSIDIDTTFNDQNWWSNQTKNEFCEAIKCLRKCNEGLVNTSDANCNATILENLADYAGIDLAHETYQKNHRKFPREHLLPGLSFDRNQIFWLAYSHVMCSVPTNETHDGNGHLVPSHRIIGAYRNSNYFAQDFGCRIGTNMNPEEKCRVL